MEGLIIILEIAVITAILVMIFRPRRAVIYEHERGLLYRTGKFQRLLEPGDHWYISILHTIHKVDVRQRYVTIQGQEVLSADNVSLRVSLAASFKVADPYRAINSVTSFQEALYLQLQINLRDLVSAAPVDELLARRKQIGVELLEASRPQAAELGLELISVNLKDIMFPGELKNIYAQVVNARNEGLAALERARGETAALRHLANAAKMLENNPALLQLRILQAVGSSSGNTIVLSPDAKQVQLLPVEKDKSPKQPKAK